MALHFFPELIATVGGMEKYIQTSIGLGCMVLGVAVSTMGMMWLLRTDAAGSKNEFVVHQLDQQENDSSTPQPIWVDVAGAVEQPGLYELPSSARTSDALQAAGGLAEQADELYLARTVNLAQPLQDGEKVYIPFEGEQHEALRRSTGVVVGASTTGEELISINTATQTMLETLTGIGEKRASSIIENRPYSTLQELVEREVITQRQFDEIAESLTL